MAEINGTQDAVVQEGVHNYSSAESYVWPTDPAVLEKLEWFHAALDCADDPLGALLPAGDHGVMAPQRRGCQLVPESRELDRSGYF